MLSDPKVTFNSKKFLILGMAHSYNFPRPSFVKLSFSSSSYSSNMVVSSQTCSAVTVSTFSSVLKPRACSSKVRTVRQETSELVEKATHSLSEAINLVTGATSTGALATMGFRKWARGLAREFDSLIHLVFDWRTVPVLVRTSWHPLVFWACRVKTSIFVETTDW